MTLYFPDLNLWVALSVAAHSHNTQAWNWFGSLAPGAGVMFSRYTHIGLLRLLTNPSVMGEETLTLRAAWTVYDRWQADPRIGFVPEPGGLDTAFREATRPFAMQRATKWVGDCYLLAFAKAIPATLVTFDAALHAQARKQGQSSVIPA